MLNKFKEEQFVAYSLLTNAIKNDKLSHAYLIDANHYDDSHNFILSFVKDIICGLNHDDDCILCKRIDNNNYPELKIIESEGNIIKKEQLLELQSDFSRSSIEGNYRIYIIKDCDKMNKQASNCLLKFLEEPNPGIIAILVTNNFSKLLTTIISRCQVIRLNNIISLQSNSTLENFALINTDNKEDFLEFLNNEKMLQIIEDTIYFIDYFEENGLDILIYMKKLWYNKFSTREDAGLAIMLMVYFYYDLLNFKINNDKYFFCDKVELIEKCANMNSIDSILHKIEVVNYGYEMINYNLNMNLLLDDIVIRLGDVR